MTLRCAKKTLPHFKLPAREKVIRKERFPYAINTPSSAAAGVRYNVSHCAKDEEVE
jgi:hypothetical protein